MTEANAINAATTGIVGNTGTAFTGTAATAHAVMIGGSTSSTLTNVGPTATAGQVLQSAGSSADPAFSTATYPSTTTVSQLLYSSSANVVAGLATANSAALVTNSTGVPSLSGSMTNGQVIIGSTSATPTAANLTAGTGVSITNGAGSVSIGALGMGLTWTTVTSTTTTMVVGTGYFSNASLTATFNLPAASNVGDMVGVVGLNASHLWSIQAGAGQIIKINNNSTGTAGSVSSGQPNCSLILICTVANTTWVNLSIVTDAPFSLTSSGLVNAVGNSLNGNVGTGSFAGTVSTTLVTPNIGTPSAGVLTSCTGLPVSSGISGLGTGVATFLATPTSANLATALTTQTGTAGSAVFSITPTLVTPVLGVATATSMNFGQGATLNYYDEGTWTPAITSATVGNLNVAYATRVGNWTRMGSTVVAQFTITTSTFTYTSASGTIRISGIPFTTGSTTANAAGALKITGWTNATYSWCVVYCGNSEAFFRISGNASGQTTSSTAITEFPTGGPVSLQGLLVYYV